MVKLFVFLVIGIILWQFFLLYQISTLDTTLDQTSFIKPSTIRVNPQRFHKTDEMENETPKINVQPVTETISILTDEKTYANIHIFYYGWYGNPETNNKWLHWNHQVIPDWRDKGRN